MPSLSTKIRGLRPDEELLEDERSPASPKRRSTISRDDRVSRSAVVGDHDALAGGEAIGLQHQRIPESPARSTPARRSRGRTRGSARSGTRWRAMKSLANALLDSSARPPASVRRWAAIGGEHVDDSPTERQLGPTTVRSTRSFGEPSKLAGSPTSASRHGRRRRDPGIAGRAETTVTLRSARGFQARRARARRRRSRGSS